MRIFCSTTNFIWNTFLPIMIRIKETYQDAEPVIHFSPNGSAGYFQIKNGVPSVIKQTMQGKIKPPVVKNSIRI